jgi:hypothetical protein
MSFPFCTVARECVYVWWYLGARTSICTYGHTLIRVYVHDTHKRVHTCRYCVTHRYVHVFLLHAWVRASSRANKCIPWPIHIHWLIHMCARIRNKCMHEITHAFVQWSVFTYMHTFMHSCIHIAYTFIHTQSYTHMHIYINAFAYFFLYTYIDVGWDSIVRMATRYMLGGRGSNPGGG